jgi:hypothetical protein
LRQEGPQTIQRPAHEQWLTQPGVEVLHADTLIVDGVVGQCLWVDLELSGYKGERRVRDQFAKPD